MAESSDEDDEGWLGNMEAADLFHPPEAEEKSRSEAEERIQRRRLCCSFRDTILVSVGSVVMDHHIIVTQAGKQLSCIRPFWGLRIDQSSWMASD